ncbi:MAG: ATP-dependent helicase HrpB [Limisphaerales bacterium]|nr:MAG: ATP-dependent helicase HrpB [Limisphaerales bacterium]KAG0508494.1 MAG: ATP-dependent helicase HrpB [Limisphaerales bacterium]TXT48920.1 MAG: ATP-dependent helicase HrpB [Limisphaerales bacterium]
MQAQLPIWQLHEQIVATLRTGNRLVLVAPTGSGKTTQVPQMLADAGDGFWGIGNGERQAFGNSPHSPSPIPHALRNPFRIVVLQPRRVAARTVAARVAWERDGKLGDEVGYQIRFDDRLGDATRICFVTEGVLLRWLQDDQQLSDVAAVLFDEFHERNLLSDVALALVKRLQQTARPDLKIVVMSATLDAEPVAAYLGQAGEQVGKRESEKASEPTGSLSHSHTFSPAPVLVSEGICFPVEVRYAEHLDRRPTTEQAADAVERIVNHGGPGDVLVFMPGMGEINATINALRAADLAEDCDFIPLHGDLSPEQQDLAFCPSDQRKIVVSTNVAETSVTIDGIMHVVDSGEARVARYDAERGIQTLFIEEISRASSDQRKGRAGRTAPGTCWRLWTESGHLNRPERNTPEIQRADLAEVVLLLHSLGIKSAVTFDWLDKPDPAAVERAERLLVMLGALRERAEDRGKRLEDRGADGRAALSSSLSPLSSPSDLTDIGRQMLRLPMHPRYSRMLVEAGRRGCVPSASLCAALVSGRDLLMRVQRGDARAAENRELFEASQDSDFFTLMRAYHFAKKNGFNPETCRRYGINAKVAREVEQTYLQVLGIAEREGLGEEEVQCSKSKVQSQEAPDEAALLKCLTAGFIDQLAIRRDQGTLECEMTEGRQGTLMRESVVHSATLLVAAAIRETEGALRPLTLLGLATAVKPEWLKELYPQHLSATVTHLFDRTHKRVAAVKLARFADLVIGHEHQRETEPEASGRCLAEAVMRGWFELPNLSHEVKQFIARVNLVAAALPDLEYQPFDDAAMTAALARAFKGLTLQKEAQGASLKEGFHAHLASEQVGWLEELTPVQFPWPTGKPAKLVYSEEAEGGGRTAMSPEAQVKLQECFKLEFHPLVCEGAVPVKLWLCTPDGKRLASTCDWPHWKANEWPKQKAVVQKKFPSVTFA